MSGGVLGLDLASAWGWCYVDDSGSYIASGNHRVEAHASLGRRAYFLREKIADLVTTYSPDWIAVEKPIHNGPKTHFQTARALYVYAAAAEEVAYLREVGFYEVARSTCCKDILHDGRAKKPDGVAFARTLKPILNSDDEADAILVALTCHAHRMRTKAA